MCLMFDSQQQLADMLKLESVRQRSRGQGVTIAIIDTGIDRAHPQLASRMWIDTRQNSDVAADGIDNDGELDLEWGTEPDKLPLPAAVRPVRNIRRVEVRTLAGVVVLAADLSG
jgi:subtilisin family serine protease